MNPSGTSIEAFRNREVAFSFRGRSYKFSLSLELFSSAEIDTGSRFLLNVFSGFLDDAPAGCLGGSSPCSVLDAGSGVGVLGICAAGALAALRGPRAAGSPASLDFHVRAQDRDELARLFTEYNARRNGISEKQLSARTEPLLAGTAGQRWNLILTNIPAKAGRPVLEDFVRRSAALLEKDGLVFLVAVNTLAGFFRSQIAAAAAPLLAEKTGKEHTVFVYGAGERARNIERPDDYRPLIFDENFPSSYPFYIRNRNEYEMEGLSYRLDTVYGAPGFDEPDGAVRAAAKLAVKINLASKIKPAAGQAENSGILIHDAGQGHFALWLLCYLGAGYGAGKNGERCGPFSVVLSGRNILALGAARAALAAAEPAPFPVMAGPDAARNVGGKTFPTAVSVISAPDISIVRKQFAGRGADRTFSFIAFFPETARESAWEDLAKLAIPGSIVIAAMGSSPAERFDRKKPPAWHRLGDVRRNGFRALAYAEGAEASVVSGEARKNGIFPGTISPATSAR